MPVTVNEVPAPAPTPQQTGSARCGSPREGTDRCPGVLRPHAAADGLLVRVRLVGGRVDAAGWRALAAGARLGNGIVELTSRGNVQIRGLRPDVIDELAGRLREGGLLRSEAHDRVRNIACDPLAGRRSGAVADAPALDAVLDALDEGLCADPALAALPGRFLFCVDDGSSAAAGVDADVRLVARPAGGWSVRVGDAVEVGGGEVGALGGGGDGGGEGGALGGGGDGGARAVAAALDVARAFLRCAAGAGAWRVAELPGGASDLLAALSPARASNVRPAGPGHGRTDVRQAGTGANVRPAGPGHGRMDVRPAGTGATPLVGVLAQRDGRLAVGAVAPLGRVDAVALGLLADVATRTPVRVSTRRTVAVLDLDPADEPELTRALGAAGLVVERDTGWEGLTACAGAGACASALADVRAAATARGAQRQPGAPREHWSACARRCGQTADIERAVCARADGTWDITEGTR